MATSALPAPDPVAPPSGGGGGGITQSQADARYLRRSQNLAVFGGLLI